MSLTACSESHALTVCCRIRTLGVATERESLPARGDHAAALVTKADDRNVPIGVRVAAPESASERRDGKPNTVESHFGDVEASPRECRVGAAPGLDVTGGV